MFANPQRAGSYHVVMTKLLPMLVLCLLVTAGCNEEDNSSTATQAANSKTEASSNSKTSNKTPGNDWSELFAPGAEGDAEPISNDVDSSLRPAVMALPRKGRSGPVSPGSWVSGRFTRTSSAGVSAIRVEYSRSETNLVDTVNDEEWRPSVAERKVAFDEDVEFIVISGGAELASIRQGIVDSLVSKGWEEDSALSVGLETLEIPYWFQGSDTICLVEHGDYLVYAHERNGKYEVGTGRGTSYGAQKVVEFIESLK